MKKKSINEIHTTVQCKINQRSFTNKISDDNTILIVTYKKR